MVDFLAELTAHIPPKGKQYIPGYSLYSFRTRRLWKGWRIVFPSDLLYKQE